MTPATSQRSQIRNLRFLDTYDCFPAWNPTDGAAGNWNAEYDSTSIRDGDHLWIDHNEFADVDTVDSRLPTYFGRLYQVHGGQLDITNAASFVTASWNQFRDHDKVMLIGSSDSATADRGRLKVTLRHNVFDNVGPRAPRVRFGQVYLYNNLYRIHGDANYQDSWGVGRESAIYAHDNFFRVDPETGVTPAMFIARFNGTAIVTLRTLVDAASPTHLVDVRAAYNAVADPDLSDAVGWEPTLFGAVDPAYRGHLRRAASAAHPAAVHPDRRRRTARPRPMPWHGPVRRADHARHGRAPRRLLPPDAVTRRAGIVLALPRPRRPSRPA